MKSSGGGGFSVSSNPYFPTKRNLSYKALLSFYVLPKDGGREKFKIFLEKNAKKNSSIKPVRGYLKTEEAIELLSDLLADQLFAKTSGLGLYQEMCKQELSEAVNIILEKYNLREKKSDNI